MVDNTKKILISLKKAKSNTAKVIKMIENEDYCFDIMQQNLAAAGLLKSAHQMLIEKHLNSCFMEAMKTNSVKEKQAKVDEILKLFKSANK
jgi:CsoR family transcriptional regulator, copper-sensing transcriptional repressor